MSAEVVGTGAIANPVPPQNGVTGNRGNSRRGRNHNRRTNATATTDHNSENNSNSQDPSASSRGRGGRGRGRGPIGNASNRGAGDNRRGRGRGRGRGGGGAVTTPATSRPESRASNTNGEQEEQVIEPVGSSRRRQFGGKLTIGEGETAASSSTSPNPPTGPKSSKRSDQPQKGKNPQSQATPNSRPLPPPKEFTDLRSRLVSELSSGGYECSICYSTITTKQPVWSCNQCWNVLHLNCTKKWASSSVQKMEELNSMQEDPNIRNKPGSWRCPGCQYSREVVPKDYTCWCGRVRDPNGSKGSPHSCSQRCGKSSAGCEHGGCAEQCHPGPCSKCAVTISKPCFCGKTIVPVRCSQLEASSSSGISCSQTCSKPLNCSLHSCTLPCHDGPCDPCEKTTVARCYCGNDEKELLCGEGEAKISRKKIQVQDNVSDSSIEEWQGRFDCQKDCGREFKCGKHSCQKSCHSQDLEEIDCPRDPKFHPRCPCGATSTEHRGSCSDPIPTCSNTCGKVLACGHSCSTQCHLGDCPPCKIPVSSPCRCGESRQTLTCHERQREESEGEQVVLCNTLCRALRNCSKHECRRRCCPLYFQAKNKSKTRPSRFELEEQDPAGFHQCEVLCGKPLSCGSHQCPMTCHRSACPPCLQASFEELICHCGRTTIEPPVPCNTKIVCNFPCRRPLPSCGHPQLPHNCHEQAGCPPCVYLTERLCGCGKNVVKNVPCSRSRVSCGTVCGSLLGCGYHRCQNICCKEECPPCNQICGKLKKKCQHPCLLPCHAPRSCPEDEPCTASITLTCQCGNLQQRANCGNNRDKTLKCNDNCLLAQRNARLADALGISTSTAPITYDKEILTFYGANTKFCKDIESQLIEFIRSPLTAKILTPAKKESRKFIHDLAAYFKLNSESLDQEPRRSVSIRRRQDSKVPNPLVSESWEAARSRLMNERGSISLGQLKRTGNLNSNGGGTSTSSHVELPKFNAILLENVFGHELNSLRSFLSSVLKPIQSFNLNYLDEENVVITSQDLNSNPSRLSILRNDLKNLVKIKSNGTIQNVWLCSLDVGGKVIRREDQPVGGSASGSGAGVWGIQGSSSASTSTPTGNQDAGKKAFGGWAAVASSKPSTSKTPTPSAWDKAGVKEPVSSSQRLASLAAIERQGSSGSNSASNPNKQAAPAARLNSPAGPATSGLDSRAEIFVPGSQAEKPKEQEEENIPEEWDASVDDA